MTLEIKGLDKLSKNISMMSKQLPYTLMLTINDLIFDSQKSLNAELKGGMNVRVNTSKAFAVDKAKKTTLTGVVRMKDDWHKTALLHHYKKRDAEQIATEKYFIRQGYMTANNSAIPIKRMTKAAYRKVVAGTKTRGKMFVVSTNNTDRRTAHLHPGVYKRLKRKVKPLMLFTQEAKYNKRFDMYKTVKKVVTRRAETYFFKNLDKAMRTAR